MKAYQIILIFIAWLLEVSGIFGCRLYKIWKIAWGHFSDYAGADVTLQ